MEYLQSVERSASNAFKSLPDLAWLADGDVMSVDEHNRILTHGFSWIAFHTVSQTIAGFITAEIIDEDFYIKEFP